MKKFKGFFLFAVVIFFSSCATLFTGTSDRIWFDSNPQGARVIINGIEVCRTPCDTRVRRSISGQDVEIRLDGYMTRIITLDQAFNVVSVLNFGNVIGWGIDVLTGSIMRYDRRQYNIELERRLSEVNIDTIDVNTEDRVLTFYVMQ